MIQSKTEKQADGSSDGNWSPPALDICNTNEVTSERPFKKEYAILRFECRIDP